MQPCQSSGAKCNCLIPLRSVPQSLSGSFFCLKIARSTGLCLDLPEHIQRNSTVALETLRLSVNPPGSSPFLYHHTSSSRLYAPVGGQGINTLYSAGCVWWLVLICHERKVPMTDRWLWLMLIWCEKKILLAGWPTNLPNCFSDTAGSSAVLTSVLVFCVSAYSAEIVTGIWCVSVSGQYRATW